MKAEKGTEIQLLSLKEKVKILFIDYFVIIGLVSILTSFFNLGDNHPWIFRLTVYFFYYFIMEFFFNRTFGMKIFDVSITGKKTGEINRPFIIYSLLIFLDRFIILVIYIFKILFHSNSKLLLSEKYSGIKWVKNK